MSDFITKLASAPPLHAAGSGNTSSEGLRQAARMANEDEWSDHLLELRNDIRAALTKDGGYTADTWNEVAPPVAARVKAEIVPAIEEYAERHNLGKDFIVDVDYAVMTAAMGDAYRSKVVIPGVEELTQALLAGRLPCGYHNGKIISF